MADWLKGTWQLVAWRRIAADGTISYPLGADARGQLIYTSNGIMAVQIAAASRPPIATDDPLGGDTAARAGAYSTYLAYFGTYEINGEQVIHHLDSSLFPTGATRSRLAPSAPRAMTWSCVPRRGSSRTGRPWSTSCPGRATSNENAHYRESGIRRHARHMSHARTV